MAQRSEEIKVGSLVVLSALLFLATLMIVGGVNLLRRKQVNYVTYFKFAGGLDPGSVVRFAGRKVGTVQSADFDPQDTTRIIVRLKVLANTPVRTDSTAMISSLGFLGDNYVEISAGTKNAAMLPPGSEIPAKEVVEVADVIDNANPLVGTLGPKLGTVADTANQLALNLKKMTGPQAQQHLDRILANVDEMLVETRPPLRRTLANLDAASAKVGPAIDKADVTLDSTTTLTRNLNQVVLENRAEIHQVLLTLHAALVDARRLVGDLDDTLQLNRD